MKTTKHATKQTTDRYLRVEIEGAYSRYWTKARIPENVDPYDFAEQLYVDLKKQGCTMTDYIVEEA